MEETLRNPSAAIEIKQKNIIRSKRNILPDIKNTASAQK